MEKDQVFDPVRAANEAQRDRERVAADWASRGNMVQVSMDTLRTLLAVAVAVQREGLAPTWEDGIDAAVFDATAALGKARREVVKALLPLLQAVACKLEPTVDEVELARLRRIEAAARDILRVVRSLKGPLRMSRDTFDSLARALGREGMS